ncbi:hypothetical protein [Aeromonas veronii]|uniref:hypothetical protein n=1 Tax=Aeromonas veronii TaxID=654 RepID=UPI0011169ACB|nr:hypothetical protein [Aeromonas veronii]
MIDSNKAPRAPSQLPEGWRLVPVEPTPEMVASCNAWFIPRLMLPLFVAAYKMMLDAAPRCPLPTHTKTGETE